MSKIAFGADSICRGIDYGGVTSAQTYASLIGTASGYAASDIINAGIGGNTSAQFLARLQTDVIALGPAVCCVMVGANDYAQGVPVATYKSNLEAIADAIKSNCIKAVFMSTTMRRGSHADFVNQQPYLRALSCVAGTNGIPLIDIYNEMCAAYWYRDPSPSSWSALYASDVPGGTDYTSHLSVAGHQFVANVALRPENSNLFLP